MIVVLDSYNQKYIIETGGERLDLFTKLVHAQKHKRHAEKYWGKCHSILQYQSAFFNIWQVKYEICLENRIAGVDLIFFRENVYILDLNANLSIPKHVKEDQFKNCK